MDRSPLKESMNTLDVTSEQKAIRQFLSKPAPSSWPCGCMGTQPLPGQDPNLDYNSMKFTPVCGCAMSWVEEVEGRFYKILESRSADGITHSAVDLGPVGGPYLCNESGKMK
jgi:hypothetical protein